MRRKLLFSSLLFLGLNSNLLAGEEFYYPLPDDGVWCRYFVNMNIAGVETASPWVISSVGQKDLDGEKCRWIELKQMSEDAKKTLRVFKALVPESAFGKGKDPTAEVRTAWGQEGDQEPHELTGEGELEVFNRFVLLVLRGPTKNVKAFDEPETIDWQNGKLKCSVITGESDFESKETGLRAQLTHRILISDKIPFRMAGSKFQIDIQVLGQDVKAGAEFSIVESGVDAQSVLPNID